MASTSPPLSAVQAREQLKAGRLTATDLLGGCLERIQKREFLVKAWQVLGTEVAQAQAVQLDSTLQESGELSPLHGIPVGLKDIFSTPDLPTTWGSQIFAGRYLPETAAVVDQLKKAGALILGKTVSTEFATAAAGSTRNPHNLDHTPGGSSSGSAAAVADGMVPVAIGSQTMGSILRPASYCGIFGFKPSFGAISRYGMLSVCRDLDHVGMFARNLEDIRLLMSVLVGIDTRDPDCCGLPNAPDLPSFSNPPRIGWVAGPDWDLVDSDAQSRLHDVVEVLRNGGADITEVSFPSIFDRAWNDTKLLCASGLAAGHGTTIQQYRNRVSDLLWSWVELGYKSAPVAYARARQRGILYRQTIVDMSTRYDALLTPVTDGAAPCGLNSTGTPRFCAPWTLCGVPSLSLPVGINATGLPLGCQLVGFPQQDYQLLRLAEWCWPLLKEAFGGIRTIG